MAVLSDENIPSMIYYKLPLHLQEVMKNLGYKKGDFPISEKGFQNKSFLYLCIHILMKRSKIEIIEVLNGI